MSDKKRSILAVLGILGIVALLLGAILTLLSGTSGPSSFFSFKERVGVVTIDGAITDPEPIVSQLVEFKKDKAIRAIILRVNSPGGGVGPSQEIYREVRKTEIGRASCRERV